MKSLISLAMIMLLAFSMMHLAVAQYSGNMNTKLLYGVAKEVRSGVRYGLVTAGEGLQASKTTSRVHVKHNVSHRKTAPTKQISRKNRAYNSHSRYARYALR